MAKKISDVIKLMDLVWHAANIDDGAFSWSRLNGSMRDSLSLAIKSGFEFAASDFETILSKYRAGYWWGDAEWCYSLAISAGNLTAVKSFEGYCKRQEIIADGVQSERHGGFRANRNRERLAVGFSFTYGAERPVVTSFNDEEHRIVACTYADPLMREKIKQRFSLTRDDIIADRAERKRAAKLEAV